MGRSVARAGASWLVPVDSREKEEFDNIQFVLNFFIYFVSGFIVSEKHDTLTHLLGWGWGCQKNSDLDRSGSKVASKKKRSRGQ